MDSRQLRYVVALAEELHFGRAAKRLQISQAPFSAQIQRIERDLGHRLFDRTTRRVQVTPVGAELYRRAVEILASLDGVVSDLDLVARGRAGRLRVGFVSSAGYSVLPGALRRMRVLAPDLDLEPLPLTSAEQVDRLHEGSLDLGVVRGDVASIDLHTELLLSEELVALVPTEHPLGSAGVATPAQLSREPMVFFAAADMPGFVTEIRRVFAEGDLPQVRHRVVHQETALGLVAVGEGFTVLPDSVSSFAPTGVKVVRIAGRPSTSMHLAHPRAGLSPGAQLMRKTLRQAASRVGD